jgi:4-hydroxy-tetrahydrodipicolinate reductase
MNLALLGYGKMGKAIEKLAVDSGHNIVLTANSYTDVKNQFRGDLAVDVVLEFSAPEAAFENIKFCLQNNIPVLSGTTGWLDKVTEIEKITLSNNGTFFYASNFSLGVNLFFKLNKKLAELLANSQYVPKIDETHHIQKVDTPSGTAITLAEEIIKANSKLSSWINQNTNNTAKLPILSIREDEVSGTHIVTYQSENDEIIIKHKAYNRAGFAQGALTVAEWIIDKKGVLTMDDFLDG